MSRNTFTNSFGFSARCMAGNGLGAVPFHHVSPAGGFRTHAAHDAAGVAMAGLAGNGSLAGMEQAFLAAARDAGATTAPRPGRRLAETGSGLAALVMKLLPGRLGAGWLQGSQALAKL
jgi:hypothetical protein